jgi:hypothetical protein
MQGTRGITLTNVSIDCASEQAGDREEGYQAQCLHEFALYESLSAIAIPIGPEANVLKYLSAIQRFRLTGENATSSEAEERSGMHQIPNSDETFMKPT